MRTDIHKPSSIVAADYNYICSFSYPTAKVLGGVGMVKLRQLRGERPHDFANINHGCCDICGASFIHGDVWEHRESRALILVGHVCATKMDMVANRSEWLAERRSVRRAGWMAARRRVRWSQMRAQLVERPELGRLLRTDHRIVADMRMRVIAGVRLTDKQMALLEKLALPKVVEPLVPVPAGRFEVEAIIVSTKFVETMYGGTLKMLIRVEIRDEYWGEVVGVWKAFGTVPSLLGDRVFKHGPLAGTRVRLRAKFEPSSKDVGFGFFSRPVLVEVLS